MGFSCALVLAAKKWCRHIKHSVLQDSFQSVAPLEQICDYILKLPYRELHFLSFYALTLKFILTSRNTSKCKSDIEAQFKNSAFIKGSSWHQMLGKCEHANQSSGLCCWQHSPGIPLNTQSSNKSRSTLIFNSFSNTSAMLNLETLGSEILKSYCWSFFLVCFFNPIPTHKHHWQKSKTRTSMIQLLLRFTDMSKHFTEKHGRPSSFFKAHKWFGPSAERYS